MTKYIKIAGYTIELNLLYEKTFAYFGQYLVSGENAKPDLVISTSYGDLLDRQAITNEGTKIMDGSEEHRFFDLYRHEFFSVYNKIAETMPTLDTFLMHGVAVGMDDSAYMLTAPSGVGKTTRATLWTECYPQSFIINGDKPLIKVTDTEVFACGTPWCGKEGMNTNTMLPLRGVFFVERIKDNENDSIQEISIGQALSRLLKQIYFPSLPESRKKIMELLQKMNQRVQFYVFRISPTEEAIRLAYETIRQ